MQQLRLDGPKARVPYAARRLRFDFYRSLARGSKLECPGFDRIIMSAHKTRFNWESHFLQLFDLSLARYKGGDRDFDNYYADQDLDFLRSIGYKAREFSDFVEDYGDGGDPNPTQAVLIAAVRRDYLMTIQGGKLSDKIIVAEDLPAKSEELGGFVWLPRIITKAEGKLRGELDPDIMYCCGGDRNFLRERDIHPADFLRVVWAADGDEQRVLDYVRNR